MTGRITVASIKQFTGALASDAMEGRGPGQPGGDRAARWIADQFKLLGLKPLGDGTSYLQAVKFIETTVADSSSFTVDGASLALGSAWAPFSVNDSRLSLSAGLVFVGYGVVDPALHRNDLEGVNLSGKIAVLFQEGPANVSAEVWRRLSQQRYVDMARAGARAFVLIDNGRSLTPMRMLADYLTRPKLAFADAAPGGAGLPTSLPIFGLDDPSAAAFVARAGGRSKIAFGLAERDDFRAIDLKGSAEITVENRSRPVTSYNVLGYLPGSDPTLAAEAVFFSAHYDAYGKIRGRIYNGAADNAIGTAEMLAVAKAFSTMSPRPRRSLVFLAATGEERGLLGSRYWAEHPTWNIERVAANLNLDGIGTEIFGPVKQVIGFGAEHSSIGTMLESVLQTYGITVMPDPIPEEGVFMRSDHYSFVERGVPALMLVGAQAGNQAAFVKSFKDWEAVYYHQPSDDVYPTWHWPGAKTVADVMGILGLRIAQQDAMPTWSPTSLYRDLRRGNTAPLPVK